MTYSVFPLQFPFLTQGKGPSPSSIPAHLVTGPSFLLYERGLPVSQRGCEDPSGQTNHCPHTPTRSSAEQLLGLEGPTPRPFPSLPLMNIEESDDPTLEKQAFVFINQREGSQREQCKLPPVSPVVYPPRPGCQGLGKTGTDFPSPSLR